MSPAAAAYFSGAASHRGSKLIFIPRLQEYLTAQTFERTARALRIPLTSQEPRK